MMVPYVCDKPRYQLGHRNVLVLIRDFSTFTCTVPMIMTNIARSLNIIFKCMAAIMLKLYRIRSWCFLPNYYRILKPYSLCPSEYIVQLV